MSRHVANDAMTVQVRQAAIFRIFVMCAYSHTMNAKESNIYLVSGRVVEPTNKLLSVSRNSGE